MKKLGFLIVGLFLFTFMVVPITSMVLMAFVGEPVAVFNPAATGEQLSQHFSFKYFAEFFTTKRYRAGLINSVGLAPLCAVMAWALMQPLRMKGRRQALVMAAVFVAAALFAVVWPSFMPQKYPDGSESLGRILAPGKYWFGRLVRSFGYCPMVTMAATVLGVGVAFCITRTAMPGRGLVRILCIFPLALPSFLGALAFKVLLGEHGMITNLMGPMLREQFLYLMPSQSALAAGFVQAFLFFPLVVLTTAAALDRTDPSLGEASNVMGATSWYTFWTVSLPIILPGIAAGSFLVFIRCFGDYAALSLLLPIQYPVVVCEAYKDLTSAEWGGASMLSTLMIVTVLTLLALQKQFVESGTFQTVTGRAGGQDRPSGSFLSRYGSLAFVAAVFSVPLSFLASTLLVSFAKNWGTEALPPAYTAIRYKKAFGALFEENSPLFNSFALVLPALLGATILSFTIAFLISRSNKRVGQFLDFATMLPFVVPGVAFAVALISAFNRPPLELHFTVYIVVLAYIVTRVPYGVRSTLASFQQIGGSMEESSKTMGATMDLTLAKVTVPLVLPGVLAGAIMVFISCMEDVSITLMCCPPRWYPASIYVFHEINKGALFEASAYGVILLGLVLIPYLIAHKLGAKD